MFQVDENMSKAQKNNALHEQLFYFRKDITTQDSPPQATAQCQSAHCGAKCEPVYMPMSINEIINGKVRKINLINKQHSDGFQRKTCTKPLVCFFL